MNDLAFSIKRLFGGRFKKFAEWKLYLSLRIELNEKLPSRTPIFALKEAFSLSMSSQRIPTALNSEVAKISRKIVDTPTTR